MVSVWKSMAAAALAAAAAGCPASAEEITPFMRGLAQAASDDTAVAAFYRESGYEAIWTDPEQDDRARLSALIVALDRSEAHALPSGRFNEGVVRRTLNAVRTEGDRARAEVDLSRLFLAYAHAVQSGILDPQEVSDGIKREAPRRDGGELLEDISTGVPGEVLSSLPPSSAEYSRLVRARFDLADTVAAGGWGDTVLAGRFEQGDRGAPVVALRNRLIAMGYLERTAKAAFDQTMETAVRAFQEDHGLVVDGVVGGETLDEINRSAEDRLGQVVVAMERERWLNFDRGARHVWVNLADFTASIVDEGQVTFQTRAVVGASSPDRRSPEFSDEMEHMVVNPTWHVPRSIAINEYLPSFRRNPYSNGQLQIYYQGQPISRDRINWSAVTASNWPFALKQPPSRSNALGLVKFMFPNRWNIYLHDTPAKNLFERNTRAFSHGCIRLQEPFEFAYALLARQTDDPRGVFSSALNGGQERRIELDQHVPVHLVYRTAITTARGDLQFRADIYGRDAQVLAALRAAGVEIGGLPS